MTTEEAIKIFEAWAECKYRPTHDAAVLALSALRAQQERENPKPITNAERIRAMSDEELAEFLSTKLNDDFYDCPDLTLQWLQQPAE